MAHALEMVNGVAQMAYVAKNGTPWHGLGVPVEDCLTPEQMLKACGADWNVVTYLVDHKLGRTQNNRLTSAWYGNGSRLKLSAMNTALELAKAA